MAPNAINNPPVQVGTEENVQLRNVSVNGNQQQKLKFVWINILELSILHVLAVYGLWIVISQSKWKLFIYQYIVMIFIGFGITAGVHRLWAHRTYEAKLPLRILLMILQTMTLQSYIYKWAREHRVHHKFTDTDADPHNSRRGFFFSHMGWLMVRKHNDVKVKGKTVDVSDLKADPVVMFQKKYYAFAPIVALTPCIIPCYFWGESWWHSFLIAGVMRYMVLFNFSWLINSFAHIYGSKPYDKGILPGENMIISLLTNGEAWHNYHHTFPWDYKTAELGNYRCNFTNAFLDLMAKIGWAYNLKTASPQLVKKRAERTGDGSWVEGRNIKGDNIDVVNPNNEDGEALIWGWGDKDMKAEDVDLIKRQANLKEI